MIQKLYYLAILISLLIVVSCSTDEDLITDTPPVISDLCINEFMADNETTLSDEYGNFDDWIEIYNTSADTICLADHYLSDDPEMLDAWQFPDASMIEPGGFLLIWCDDEEDQGEFHASLKLSKDGETIYLSSNDGNIIDYIEFEMQTTDVSMGRQPDGSDNWIDMPEATPGSSNNIPAETEIYINEFMAKNSETVTDQDGEYDDWVELYNASAAPVDLAGFFLSDDDQEVDKWQFPPVQIEPNGYLLIWCDEDSLQAGLHASFKLSGSGEHLILTAPNGFETVDSYQFGEQNDDISEGRMPDGTENWQFFEEPTPGNPNQ